MWNTVLAHLKQNKKNLAKKRQKLLFWPKPADCDRIFLQINSKFFQRIIFIWCKYIGGVSITPPVTRVTRDVGKNFWEKISKQKSFLFCWATFWQHFFVATANSNKKQQMWKKWGLLLLVVATKFFYRFFLYHHVGAHLKIFWRARAATHRKNA